MEPYYQIIKSIESIGESIESDHFGIYRKLCDSGIKNKCEKMKANLRQNNKKPDSLLYKGTTKQINLHCVHKRGENLRKKMKT